MKKYSSDKSKDGYVAISILLMLTAVLLGIIVTVAHLGIGEGQSSLALSKGEDALNSAEGCMEDALLKARSSSTFGDPVGTPVTITRPSPESSCSITVVSKVGSNPVVWTMNATTATTAYKRTIQVVFNRSATGITLTSWKEQ